MAYTDALRFNSKCDTVKVQMQFGKCKSEFETFLT